MSLVTERTGGTMERLLVTPIKPWQLVAGYCLGFGVVAAVQSGLVLWACTSLIGFPNEGNIGLVIATTLSMGLVSLTLGLFVSALAKTSFQVIQLMILLVVPQILLSGIFDLSEAPRWMQVLGQCFPIHYGAAALREIMLRGGGLTDVAKDLAILWAFIAGFFVLSCLSFRSRQTH
jgi:ABC-2 type transport system permease protein